MNVVRFSRKLARGVPYLAKEIRAEISNRTPLFIGKPRVVHLWRNGPCDGGCVMCDLGYLRGPAQQKRFQSPLPQEKIPEILQQIHDLAGRGTMVSYMSGEPLLNRSLLEWVALAKRLKLDFRFTSNGYHIDRPTAARLVESGLFNLGISIESLDPAINEQIRPYRNSTGKTIAAIEHLLEEKRRQRSPISLNLKCTLTDLNLESVLDIVKRYGREEGVLVTPQIFEALDTMPQATKEKLWIKDVSRMERVVRELKALKAQGYHVNADDRALYDLVLLPKLDANHKSTMHKRTVAHADRPPCRIGTDSLFIIDDKVRLCPFFQPIGDLLKDGTTLKQMWRSEPASESRAQISKCRTVCTLSCTRPASLPHKVRTFLKM